MTKELKVLKAMVFLDADGSIYLLDAIRRDGQLWFVPDWIGPITGEWRQPVRIVAVDGLQFQSSDGGQWDVVVNELLSKAILDGQTKPDKGSRYRVVESPDIRISAKKTN